MWKAAYEEGEKKVLETKKEENKLRVMVPSGTQLFLGVNPKPNLYPL